MVAVQGYFDGVNIRSMEQISIKPNQKVIITVMDDFVDFGDKHSKKSMRGALTTFADPALAEKEKDAWEHAAVEKYGNP